MDFATICEKVANVEFSRYVEDECGFVLRTRKGGHIVAFREQGRSEGHVWGRIFFLVGSAVEHFEVHIYRFKRCFLILRSTRGICITFNSDGTAYAELCRDWGVGA